MQYLNYKIIDMVNECELAFPGDGAVVALALILDKVADNLEEIADALNKEGGSDE